jgi:hypothetical protein
MNRVSRRAIDARLRRRRFEDFPTASTSTSREFA